MKDLQRKVIEAFVEFTDRNILKELKLEIRYHPYFINDPNGPRPFNQLKIEFPDHYMLLIKEEEHKNIITVKTEKGPLYGRIDDIEQFLKDKLGKDLQI